MVQVMKQPKYTRYDFTQEDVVRWLRQDGYDLPELGELCVPMRDDEELDLWPHHKIVLRVPHSKEQPKKRPSPFEYDPRVEQDVP